MSGIGSATKASIPGHDHPSLCLPSCWGDAERESHLGERVSPYQQQLVLNSLYYGYLLAIGIRFLNSWNFLFAPGLSVFQVMASSLRPSQCCLQSAGSVPKMQHTTSTSPVVGSNWSFLLLLLRSWQASPSSCLMWRFQDPWDRACEPVICSGVTVMLTEWLQLPHRCPVIPTQSLPDLSCKSRKIITSTAKMHCESQGWWWGFHVQCSSSSTPSNGLGPTTWAGFSPPSWWPGYYSTP